MSMPDEGYFRNVCYDKVFLYLFDQFLILANNVTYIKSIDQFAWPFTSHGINIFSRYIF